MDKPIYKFRPHTHIRGNVPAQAVGEELARLREAHEGITPKLLVEQSRPEKAALHPCFTWDDAEAAEHWRIEEARNLVKSIRVVYPDSTSDEPAYVNVQRLDTDGSRQNFYESTRKAVEDFSLYESAWRLANSQLNGALKAISDLEEIAKDRVSDETVARAESAAEARLLTTQAIKALENRR